MRTKGIKVLIILILTGFLWWFGNLLFNITGCGITLFGLGYENPIPCSLIQKSILPIAFFISIATTILLFRGRK